MSDPDFRIAEKILVIRGQRVLLIADLAGLYGVTARRLSEQVRRNRVRFPADFVFSVEINDIRNLVPQFAASSWGGRRGQTLAFTEHGAIMAATVLNSPRAVEMSVYVVRAFVKLREVLASNTEIAAHRIHRRHRQGGLGRRILDPHVEGRCSNRRDRVPGGLRRF